MKKFKKFLALFLAVLTVLSSTSISVTTVAQAAEGAYTVICEPNIKGGFENETYGSVASVWEDIYYDPVSGQTFEGVKANKGKGVWQPRHLMKADSTGVHSVSAWYQKLTGLSAGGFAAAQNFDGKMGVINASGEVVVDFIYDTVKMPNDDGYVLAINWDANTDTDEYEILDLNSGKKYDGIDFAETHEAYLSSGGFWCDKVLESLYEEVMPYANGYAIVHDRIEEPDGSGKTVNMIVDANREVVLSDESENYFISRDLYDSPRQPAVSVDGLIRVEEKVPSTNGEFYGGKYGYINLQKEIVFPCKYLHARDFQNGYAVVNNSTLLDGYKKETTISIEYGRLSDVSKTGVIWYEKHFPFRCISAVYQVEPHGASSQPTQDDAKTEEYIYDVPDPGEEMDLDIDRMDKVNDKDSAVEAVEDQVASMSDEQKQSATGIDLATLYAETAVYKAASTTFEGSELTIDAAAVAQVGQTAAETLTAVEHALEQGGISVAREMSSTVLFRTDEDSLNIHVDPDVLTAGIDKVRVETPTFALTFKLSDLAPDLTEPLTFTARGVFQGVNAAMQGQRALRASSLRPLELASELSGVAVELPRGSTTNPVTVSLPSGKGDKTYQAVANAEGEPTASKHNPATGKLDGKINVSGTYSRVENKKDFTDISNKSAEMQKAIRYLASKGIIKGTGDGTTFSPNSGISRAEVSQLMVKALGKMNSSASANFKDVSRKDWFYSAAASSQKYGIIKGYDDNTFRGKTNIPKDQILAVSARVLKNEMGYKTPSNPTKYLSQFKDTVATWAQPEVALATRENLVVKRTDGTFSGTKNMTRGDAAIIIYRLFQKIW